MAEPYSRAMAGGVGAKATLPLLSLGSISKTFSNGTVALSRMSLDLAAGEFVSLLGPSGCGKSTALRIIAGLGQPTTGRVTWHKSPRELNATDAQDIGFVFQEPTLMPWATVFDNVRLPLRLKGLSKAQSQDRIHEALALVSLDGFASAYPRELSGGMKMRVAIARALVTRPKLLLMDEPFAALDEITRNKLNDDLLNLWQAHKWTVVFVTHSVYESVYLSSRIVVMAARPGRVINELSIDAPYPRTAEFRTTASYTETCFRASKALHGAMDVSDHL